VSWDDYLNDGQKAAASFYGSHGRLLAGPGTGKTFSLTRRVMFLIEELNVEPSQISVLTFTRAAASELSKRTKKELVGETDSFPNISTLHSFSLKLILANPSKTRLPQPIRIADDYEENIIIEELKIILGIDKNEVKRLLSKLSADWGRLKLDDDDYEFPDPRFIGAWQEHRNIYGYTLRSELVYQLKGALNEGDFSFIPPIQYLLVDEYQDLNPCDLAVIKHLVDYGSELFCAGDDDQSIYGFRYANPAGIRKFLDVYSPAEDLKLQECMRCDDKILQLSLFVANQDHERITKELHCIEKANDGEVHILRFDGQRKEADGIADICEFLIEQKNVKPSEILILLRSDRHGVFSKVIQESFINKNVPVSIAINPMAPLETNEGRFFIGILQLLINPADSLAWRTLLKIRNNNIGTETFKKLYKISSENSLNFYETLQLINETPDLIDKGKGSLIQNELDEIDHILKEINLEEDENLSLFIEKLSDSLIHDDETREAVKLIFTKIIDESPKKLDLEDLLRSLNVSLWKKEQEQDDQKVSIMTMHQAKGLTAEAVFVAASEDEYIPGNFDNREEMLDSMRLLYVSLTRAKHYLFITHCQRRTLAQMHTGRNPNTPRRTLTRFLRQNVFPTQNGEIFIENINDNL
jgi:DNA helicase-2/ATP-dependent DNA helicase PcrA